MFDQDRHWLKRQNGMSSWEQGCAAQLDHLNRWIAGCAKDLGMRIPQTNHQTYRNRLWACWGWHWQSAMEAAGADRFDGQEVAASIQAGRGYTGKRNLGGDPFRDVVLAEAVCQRDEVATRIFAAEYRGLAIGVARKFSPKSMADLDEWWHDFFTCHLAAFDREGDGALAKFQGRCALSHWLPMVVKMYIRGKARQQTRRREHPDAGGGNNDEGGAREREAEPDPGAEEADCLRLFRRVTSAALAALKPRQQTVLRHVFYDGRVQKEIAKAIGVAEGRLSHIKSTALQHLLEAMHETAAEAERWQGFKDCLMLMLQQRNAAYFGDVLMRALKGLGEEENP